MYNILSIDLEEWFHANYESDLFDNSKEYEVTVIRNTKRLLDMFDRYSARATFFVLGYVAEKHPELIKEIHDRGHEIASHGYGHQLVYNQTAEEFEEDLKKSLSLLSDILPVKVVGYRAPSWSINKEVADWFYPTLLKLGFRYDASVFPVKNYLYGIPDAPRFPFKTIAFGAEIIEIPTSTIRMSGYNIPFSGGFYFRALPYPVVHYLSKQINKQGQPIIFYLHPREIDRNQPVMENLNIRDKLIHNYGIASCERKLEKLLRNFKFYSVADYLTEKQKNLPEINFFKDDVQA